MKRLPERSTSTDLRPVERRVICERCGKEFGCSRDAQDSCWCGAEPYWLPIPLPREFGGFSDCLCPVCLRELAKLLTENRAQTSR
jgi:ribosomal protein S14